MALDLAQHFFAALPELRIHPTAKRIRAFVGGDPIIDSTKAMIVWEPRRIVPSYAVPVEDIGAPLQPAAADATAEELAVEVGGAPVLDPRTGFAVHTVDGQSFDIATADAATQCRLRRRRSRSPGLRDRRLRRLRRVARGG